MHHPGRLPGTNAVATHNTTSNVTGVASAEKLSMMGVSHGRRRCSPISHQAAASSFMFSSARTFSSSATNTMAHTDAKTIPWIVAGIPNELACARLDLRCLPQPIQLLGATACQPPRHVALQPLEGVEPMSIRSIRSILQYLLQKAQLGAVERRIPCGHVDLHGIAHEFPFLWLKVSKPNLP